MAIERMFWAPVVCCVQPSAYIDVIVRSGVDGRGDHLADLQELRLGRAGDALDHLGRVALDVGLQQVDGAARVLQRLVDLGHALFVELVVPARAVDVALARLVVAGEQPVLEAVAFLDDVARRW